MEDVLEVDLLDLADERGELLNSALRSGAENKLVVEVVERADPGGDPDCDWRS